MEIIDQATKIKLEGLLSHLKAPIELILWRSGSELDDQIRQLCVAAASANSAVSIAEARKGDGPSGFWIAKKGFEPLIGFQGLPMGHEFASFVLAMLHASGHPPKLSEQEVEAAKNLPEGLMVETFYSQSCHNCPDTIQAINAICSISGKVKHVAIDGASNQQLAEERGVFSVPAVHAGGVLAASGRMGASEILAALSRKGGASGPKRPLFDREPYDMAIIGGGPAGASAAIYAARKGLKVALVAERFGGQVMDTQGIENYPGVLMANGPEFGAKLREHAEAAGAKTFAARVDKLEKLEGGLIRIEADGSSALAKTAVIATGAKWRELGAPGESFYKNKGVAFCPHCDGPLFIGKKVAVAGGGNSGVEAAIDLAGICESVELFERSGALRADKTLLDRLASLPNIIVRTSAAILEIEGDGSSMQSIRWRDEAGSERRSPAKGIFIQIGLSPNTSWLPSSIQLNAKGEIATGKKGETSVDGIYAAGDCSDAPYKQIAAASGDGAKASLGAFERLCMAPGLS